MNIYYYCPFNFNFNAGATSQVIKDYKYLSRHGHAIFLYGTYEHIDNLKEIQDYIGTDPITLLAKHGSTRWNRNVTKFKFLLKIIRDRSSKVIVSRNYNKIKEICSFKALLGKFKILMELHEDALPHLLPRKKHHEIAKIKNRYAHLFHTLDGLILTNYSQEPILKQEFTHLPPYSILPNGVEVELFSKLCAPSKAPNEPLIITYVGQFTKWKNVELLFQALTFLDTRFILRIAGGKNDEKCDKLINQWTEKYGLIGRIDYKGFVTPKKLASDVLQGSSVLLLPLGDNMESRYFTSPMKLFEYMATHIPIVAVNYPSINMITGSDTVYLSENNPQDFAKQITLAVGNDNSSRSAKTRELAQKFSYKMRAQNMHHFIESLYT